MNKYKRFSSEKSKYDPWKSCLRKMEYKSMAEAKEYRPDLRPYKCNICSKWHVTKIKAP